MNSMRAQVDDFKKKMDAEVSADQEQLRQLKEQERKMDREEKAFKAKVLVAFGLAAEWVAIEKARAVRRAKNNVSRRIFSDGVFGKTAACVWNRRQCLFV